MRPARHETQHERTRLSWNRSCLALAVLTLAEIRLSSVGHPILPAVVFLAGGALVGGTWWAAAIRQRADAAALSRQRTLSGGRTPAWLAACAAALGVVAALIVLLG